MEIQQVDHLLAAALTGDRGRIEVLIGRDPDTGDLGPASDLDPEPPDA